MNIIQFVSLLLLLTVQCCLTAPSPTADYANSMELQPNIYYMYWNYTTTDVLIELHVKTTGWIGFGLSPNGGMDGSDVIVAWLDSNGKANFTRKIKICDKSNEDMDIPDGTPFVIFSYGTKFTDGDISYHDFRGTKSIQFTSSLNAKVDIDMSQVETAEFRVDVFLILCFLLFLFF